MNANRGRHPLVWLLPVALAAVVAFAAIVLTSAGPRIVTVSPGEGAVDVPITGSIQLTFSQPMDPASVESRLQIEPEVAGRWVWVERAAVFQPQTALAPGATYTVSLEPGAVSQRGQALKTGLVWRFQTRRPQLLYLGRTSPGAEVRQLFVAPLDGTLPRQLTDHPWGVWDYTMHPRGDAIAYSVLREDGGSDLWRMGRDGTGQRRLLTCPEAACLNPAWSPDGRQLAYEQRGIWAGSPNLDPQAARIWLLDLERGETQPLFDYDVPLHSPVWSPKGRRLAYVSPLLPGVEVYNQETEELQQFGNEWGNAPVWSPDGDWLVMPELLLAGESLVVRLVRVDLNTEEMVDISGGDDFVKDVSPAWSPAGGWIAFGRQFLDNERWTPGRQIWLTRPDAGESYPLLEEAMGDHLALTWRPDGGALAYAMADLSEGSQPVPDVSVWWFDLLSREKTRVADDAVLPRWLP